ncbi:MAG TPA: hypothetical protein DCS13_11225 [Candidatus Margulisbacteria bacterium]|nr:MAG: hypothetical protein A2X43_06425 [Candidatus Margulisbacteria bacterium GWD2_39_127]OGI05585.1 MAG: hypothetical protein A2X42_08805 [Candidatus Margulisbacteria bacterium GWF2_38_17]HAR64025.1 hypothetical protein [Candidatus Margulisiibacteriota bacterium]
MVNTIIIYSKDNSERLQYISVLRARGHDVIGVSDGFDVLIKSRKYSPQVIIVCSSRNDNEYLEVAKSIKANDKINTIPTILVLDNEDSNVSETVQEAIKNSIDAFIFRPFDNSFANCIISDLQRAKDFPTRKCILIADDERVVLDALSFGLQKEGYVVFTADDGREAFEKAKSLIPDLIIMDYNMPQCNGLYSVRRIREVSYLKSIPVIGHTALVNPDIIAKSINAGCSTIIKKPTALKEICSKIKAIIGE